MSLKLISLWRTRLQTLRSWLIWETIMRWAAIAISLACGSTLMLKMEERYGFMVLCYWLVGIYHWLRIVPHALYLYDWSLFFLLLLVCGYDWKWFSSYRYHKNPETALKDAYFYSSLIKIEDLFKNTQNNGCNLHNEYDIIHRIHPSDDYVLKELGNVMLFKQMMNYIDRFSKVFYWSILTILQGDTNQIRLLLEYIRDIIVSVNKRGMTWKEWVMK